MIFNTHTHINDKLDSLDNLVKECQENNVTKLAVIGYDYPSSLRAIQVSEKYENIYNVVGLQPNEVINFKDSIDIFKPLITHKKCVAVGEIGLDYYYGKESKEQQIEFFIKQIEFAIEYRKPIVIHCRDAHEDTYNILSKYAPKLKGIILHCYTGSVEMMHRYLKLGCYISISGIVTFKNSVTIKEVVKNCPMDKLLVETDDPYLSPVPYRGQENKPSYVTFVVQEIAKLKELTYDEVAKQTYDNAMKVFNI